MKKLLTLFIALIMILSLAACGKETPPDAPDLPEFSRGVWEDNVYRSDYLALSYTLPEGWVAASDDEIAEMMGLSLELLDSDMEFSDINSIYDFSVQDPTTGTNALLMMENLTLYPGGTAIKEKDYLKALHAQLMEQPFYDHESKLSIHEVSVAGYSYQAIDVALAELPICQTYLARRVGDYMNVIILTYAPETVSLESLVDSFGALE